MSEFLISGGRPLEGELTVHGAKNSVLPVLAASLLAREPVLLRGCPRLTDVTAAVEILRHLGCAARWEDGGLLIDPVGAAGGGIPEDLMRSMRSSIIFLGPVLARNGAVHLTYPGGCELGPRPIGLHLSATREADRNHPARSSQVQGLPRAVRAPHPQASDRHHQPEPGYHRGSDHPGSAGRR